MDDPTKPKRPSLESLIQGRPSLESLVGDTPNFSDTSVGSSSTADASPQLSMWDKIRGALAGAIPGGAAAADFAAQAGTAVKDIATHPMTALDRTVDAVGFGIPRRAEAVGESLGNSLKSLVDQKSRPGYSEIRERQERERADFKQAHPEAAFATDVGGSLVGGVKAAGALAPKGAGLLRSALANAGVAGAQTLGETGNLDDAKTSAAIGGGLTIALGGAGTAVQSIFSPKTAGEEAAAILDDIAGRAGVQREPVEQYAARKATERATAAGPLYTQSANDVVPVTPEMARVLDDPLFRAAHERAEALATRQGRTFTPLYAPDGSIQPDAAVSTIQGMKRRINDILKEAKTGTLPPTAAGKTQTLADEEISAVREMRRTLTDETGKGSPAFAQAEATFAKGSQPISAARRGEQFLNKGAYKDAAAIEKELARLTPDAQEGFRQGALSALQRQADRQVETVTGYRRLLKNTDLQERVTALLPVSEREAFRNAVERQGLADAIRRLVNAPGAVNNIVKPITTLGRGARILGKQAGLGESGAVVADATRAGGAAELARYLAEKMRDTQ